GYAVDLDETQMQPSLHAREQKKVALSDPLFITFFGMAGLPERSEEEVQADAILIGLGGSDRRYYRVRNDGKTAVLMECRQEDPDYDRHLLYTRFFEAHSVPVPGILETDETGRCALFEDLGDTSLYSYLKLPRDAEHVEDIYQSVLDILVKMHSLITRHIDECPPLKTRVFDYDHLRWETAYFLERFVIGLKETALRDKAALEEEFHRLAQKVDAYRKVAIHRDFQCQNIMITAGGIPRLIDFQGARMAPAAYDVASILWDPYCRIADGLREALLHYYVEEMRKQQAGFDEREFSDSLIPCRLQRHMQALGAYGFLSAVKGKKYFLKHVPEALRLLREDAEAVKSEYPELYKLVKSLS
ncbi:MAG TPA: phosphotransferase, partial [Nitrospirota bacterium]